MKNNRKYLYFVMIGSVAISLLNSCAKNDRLLYFKNLRKDSTSVIHSLSTESLIHKNDILQINISTADEATTRDINALSASSTTSANSALSGISGYLVDESGVIKLPMIGSVAADGLSKSQLASSIANKLMNGKFAVDPVVSVRILNYRVTVLGEVNKPGVINVPNERMTLLEAIGQAGDLTPYAKRDGVRLIREVNGERKIYNFSLATGEIYNKDFYYLQNQDLIIVDPNNARAGLTAQYNQVIPLAFSSISLLIVIISLFRK